MLNVRLLVLLGAMTAFGGRAIAAPPQVVPPGWHPVRAPGATARLFVSPDGSARVRFGHEAAHAGSPEADLDRIIHKLGERVTYQDQGGSWFVVSGYRDGDIFYRKGSLACQGSRWNLIEFRYPREAKRDMDATVKMVAHNIGAYRGDCR
jgi:hypothetical protein